jgi:hypothetical protein
VAHQRHDSGDVRGGHRGAGHVAVAAAIVPAGSDIDARGRNVGLVSVSHLTIIGTM